MKRENTRLEFQNLRGDLKVDLGQYIVFDSKLTELGLTQVTQEYSGVLGSTQG